MDRYDPYTDKFIRDTIDRQAAIDICANAIDAITEGTEETDYLRR